VDANVAEQKCLQCKFLVETFKAGMRNTEKQHFAGGNTDWEERKLGKFATSETRFIEVLESACKKDVLSDSKDFNSLKDINFKCHTLLEEHEDLLEQWFFKKQESDPDLNKYFCIDELHHCCPTGHFGRACEPCPAVHQQLPPCFGRGVCDGDGTRGGTGKCKCDRGYVGINCNNCDGHFYPITQNNSYIECGECFDGCASGCTAGGQKGCRACRTGYIMDAEEGCKDVDECLEEGTCTKANERCINLVGSYRCECSEGFRRNKNHECELDIEAQKQETTGNETGTPSSTETPPTIDSEVVSATHSEL